MSVIYTTLVRITIDTVSGTSQTSATYLFSEIDKPLHIQNPTTALPYLVKNIQLGQEIKENITASGRTTLVFRDDANATGTYFWRQWVSKNPFYKNRIVEILSGTAGIPESSYSVIFKGVIENIRFKNDETVEIVIKTLLQLTNNQLPRPTNGKLQGTIATGGGIVVVTMQPNTGLDPFSPTGHQYVGAGFLKIGNEIFQYDGVNDISGGNKTQFEFPLVLRGAFTAFGWDPNTTAHSDGDIIQEVIAYPGQNPIVLLQNLLSQAGINITDIDTQSFTDVQNDPSLLAAQVTGILHQPTEIKTYMKELRELTFTSLFQNENQQIECNLLQAPSIGQTFKQITDDEHIIFKSVSIDRNEISRITRVTFEYDEQPDGTMLTETTFVDAERESRYKEQKSRIFRSRWLRSSLAGESLAGQSAQSLIRVFGDGKSLIQFDVETKDKDLKVGELFELSTGQIQTNIGGPLIKALYQVVKKEQVAINRWRFKAFDARLSQKFGFYTRDSIPNYVAASLDDRIYGFYADNNNKMSNGDSGYFYS